MSGGGFLVKFDDKKKTQKRCYAATFDYDEWSYATNNNPAKAVPPGTKRIIVEIE